MHILIRNPAASELVGFFSLGQVVGRTNFTESYLRRNALQLLDSEPVSPGKATTVSSAILCNDTAMRNN